MKILSAYVVLILSILTYHLFDKQSVDLQQIEPNTTLNTTLGLDLSDGVLDVLSEHNINRSLESFSPTEYIMESDSQYMFIRDWSDYDQLILDTKSDIHLSGYLLEDDNHDLFILVTYQVKSNYTGNHQIKIRHADTFNYTAIELQGFWLKGSHTYTHSDTSIRIENETIIDRSNRELQGYIYEGVLLFKINDYPEEFIHLEIDYFAYYASNQTLTLGFNQFKKSRSGYIPQRIRLIHQGV